MNVRDTHEGQSEINALRDRLRDCEETLSAIRSGEVDAVVVSGPRGPQVYTLSGAESPYRLLVEQMREGAVSLSAGGLIIYSNSRFAELVRTPLTRVIGQHIQEFIDPADHDQYGELSHELPAGGAKAELRLRTGDGSTVPVYLSVSRYEMDDLEGLCATVTDLTEQKRNQEIVASEKLARAILDQATEGIVVTDTQGRIIRANKAAHDIAGQNILWRAFDDVFRLDLDPAAEAGRSAPHHGFRAALTERKTQTMEARLVRTGRHPIDVIAGVGPLTNSSGQVVGSIVTFTDITERKRSEETIQKSNEQLRRANSDLEQFAYSASHDLQQPIRNVAIYSQLLKRRCGSTLDESSQECLSFLRAGALQMEKLVRDLLAYTRVTSEPEGPYQETDANVALEATRIDLAAAIRESGAQITADRLPTVGMREVHLQQLFQNLIANAIKYRSAAPIAVHVSGSKSGESLVFSVRDNGLGIAREYQKQIFGVFKRLYSEDKYAGTGIGLAICQRIVDRYGCRIWVESEPGQGSTFFFTAPS